jgi:homogentisate 1,2-dioxygenase
MKTTTKFVLYLEQIAGLAAPRARTGKSKLYNLRRQLEQEGRFAGRSELLAVMDRLSSYLG